MPDPKSDPLRRCMRLEEWPERDRLSWLAAVQSGDPFDDQGLAAHWTAKTCRSVVSGYGRYLTYLARQEMLDYNAGPGERLSEERLRKYLQELQTQVASATVAGRVRCLTEALRVMVPDQDYPYLRRVRQRLKVRVRPSRDKRSRIVPITELFRLGLKLIDRAETSQFSRELWRASCYRDGLCIMLLACRPIRRGNLAAMRLGIHLVKQGDAFALAFNANETKNHRPYECFLHSSLTPWFERYLAHYRPLLLCGHRDDHLWISWRSVPMTEENLYGRVVKHTKEAFGHAVSPHMFRDSAITSLGEDNPELTWLGVSLLHHSDPAIAERHYDHARSGRAVKDYQKAMIRERRQSESKP